LANIIPPSDVTPLDDEARACLKANYPMIHFDWES
jgi:hypothetical protein